MMEKPRPSAVTDAIRRGDLHGIKELFAAAPEMIGYKTSYTVNWLYYAAGHSSIEVVRYFLEELQLDPNENHAEFGNALYNAAFYGRNDNVEYLLGKEVELNATEPERNPLFAAISGDGSCATIQLLLSAGMDSTATYLLSGASTPIGAAERAVEQGKHDVAQLLVNWNHAASKAN